MLNDAKVKAYLMDNAHHASTTMTDLLESKQDTVRFQASKDILDRTIGKASDTITLINDNKSVNIESVNVFMSRILESTDTPPVLPPETLE